MISVVMVDDLLCVDVLVILCGVVEGLFGVCWVDCIVDFL